jgi:hypothetical protein
MVNADTGVTEWHGGTNNSGRVQSWLALMLLASPPDDTPGVSESKGEDVAVRKRQVLDLARVDGVAERGTVG